MFAFRYMYHVDQFASVVNQEFVGQCFYHRNKQIHANPKSSEHQQQVVMDCKADGKTSEEFSTRIL